MLPPAPFAMPLLQSRAAVAALTALTMAAFAANSVLARLALATTGTGAATFTAVRLAVGAAVLWAVVRGGPSWPSGSWASAAALFAYAMAFSLAYLSLTAGTGALLLFGAVQVTMVGWGLARGARLSAPAWLGLAAAMGGLVYLVLPGLEAPAPGPAALMALSGVAWGVYSLRGRGTARPAVATAGNFARAVPMALAALAVAALLPGVPVRADVAGLAYAALSGGLTSGLGYVAWYAVLPALRPASAATVQLSVPALAALGGVLFLSEPVTLRLVVASVAILGGIALVVRSR